MSTFHLPPGVPGLIVGLGVFPVIGLPVYLSLAEGPFNLDPRDLWNAFEPFLAKYLRLGEFIVGLATGSIVLLVGSSALRGQGLALPWYYASPLYVLCSCVLWGIGFMVWLTYHYDDYQHGETKHTKKAYALSLTLGFSALFCFLLGYAWLIFMVTMQR
jgi:hypothetical protein